MLVIGSKQSKIKMCSEYMHNWLYFPLGDQEQIELFPKSKS